MGVDLVGMNRANMFVELVLPFALSIFSLSLVSRPHPDFCRFQYGKAGEALVSFLT